MRCSTGAPAVYKTTMSAWRILIQGWKASSTSTITCRRLPELLSAAISTAGRRKSASEDGFLRLVWGLGTRAVDRVGNDYPRLVALSHPLLHPQAASKDIRHYSQQYVDVIDLETNSFRSLPIHEVLSPLPGAALPGPGGSGRLPLPTAQHDHGKQCGPAWC